MNKIQLFKTLAICSFGAFALAAYAEGNTVRIFQKNPTLDCNEIIAEFPAEDLSHLHIENMSNARELITVNGVSFTMIRVDGGTFYPTYTPDVEKTVYTYYIAETVVTNALWEAVMGYKPEDQNKNGDNYPAAGISWLDCKAFIERLNLLTGRQFRLPSEMEWEYAARGGQHWTDNFTYAGSNIASEVGWYNGNSGIAVHPVKDPTIKPNQLGIYDMSGNVWEWCEDKCIRYNDADDLSETEENVILRVMRGGGFDSGVGSLACKKRIGRDQSAFNAVRGLRLAL